MQESDSPGGKTLKTLISIGVGALLLSGFCFYAERNSATEGATAAVERVLKAEARSLPARFEEALLKADRDALMAATRWRKKPPLHTYFSDTALSEPDSPKWLIVAGRRMFC